MYVYFLERPTRPTNIDSSCPPGLPLYTNTNVETYMYIFISHSSTSSGLATTQKRIRHFLRKHQYLPPCCQIIGHFFSPIKQIDNTTLPMPLYLLMASSDRVPPPPPNLSLAKKFWLWVKKKQRVIPNSVVLSGAWPALLPFSLPVIWQRSRLHPSPWQ